MFFLGLITGICLTIVSGYALWRKYLSLCKKFGPRTYQVAKFSAVTENNVYRIDFYLTDDIICQGYSKKCPPFNAKPEELTVTIRNYHSRRGLYRVFWNLRETA